MNAEPNLEVVQPEPTVALTVTVQRHKLAEAFSAGEEMLEPLKGVTQITNAEEQSFAGELVAAVRKWANTVEQIRKDLTAPLLDAQRSLKLDADNHTAPLLAEQHRIERLVTEFQRKERERVVAEERRRAEEYNRLMDQQREEERRAARERSLTNQVKAEQRAEQLGEQAREVITAPAPAVAKSGGTFATRKELLYEVTDIKALYAARPELCHPPEAKASAIKAVCSAGDKIPGLRLWEEDRTISRAR